MNLLDSYKQAVKRDTSGKRLHKNINSSKMFNLCKRDIDIRVCIGLISTFIAISLCYVAVIGFFIGLALSKEYRLYSMILMISCSGYMVALVMFVVFSAIYIKIGEIACHKEHNDVEYNKN